jgi:hypothetical protein
MEVRLGELLHSCSVAEQTPRGRVTSF